MILACGGLALMTGIAAGGTHAVAAVPELPADWCTTTERWEAKTLGPAIGGGCPIEGNCDNPGVRDAYAPDAGTPFKTIRVHVLVFREDDGANPAATGQEVVDQMARMNDDFAPYRVRFTYTWEYVDNTFFRYNGNDTLMKQTHAVNPEAQCNVYVTSLGGGYGTFPWDSIALTELGGIVIGDVYFEGDTSVISHEMGHNLGLWHTHHGVSEVSDCSDPCYEPASGAGGDITGDFCGDTPPTPVDWDCVYPSDLDCEGAGFAPTLPESFMSYGLPCWSIFTEQQASRIHCWFESVLTGWLVTCAGDANGDGEIGINDLLGLLAAWGSADPDYDIVVDGDVGIEDFLMMLSLWGTCP